MKSVAHLRTPPRGASGEGGPPGGPGDSLDFGMPAAGGRLLAAVAVASLLLYAAISALGDLKEHVIVFLGLYALLFALFLGALRVWWRVRAWNRVAWGLAAALVFRLALLPAAPSLSDDVHRYLWDGRVLASGANPLAHAPADPALAHLRDERWEAVAHRDVPGVYPPVSQAVFGLLHVAGAGPLAWKALLVPVDLGVALLLALLLSRLGLPPGRAMVYGWCPLVVVEVAGSGHLEPLAILPALAGVLLLGSGRRTLAGVWIGLAAAVRLLHASFVPAWSRRLGASGIVAATVVTAVLWAPFLMDGEGEGIGEGYRQYGRRWEYNAAVYPAVAASLSALDPTDSLKEGITWVREEIGEIPGLQAMYSYTDVPFLTRTVLVAGFTLWSAVLGLLRVEAMRAAYLTLGAFLLLSPTLHPWYVVQIVPFLAFFPSATWLAFTGTVALSYVSILSTPMWDVPAWALLAEYSPFAVLFPISCWAARAGR